MALGETERRKRPRRRGSAHETRAPRFATDSEREFARLLDFYQVRWQYEPSSFPIVWDAEGEPREFFRPDFYLPDMELYVELTDMKQSLVTRKNRKLRLMREHHPEVRVKLLYARDVRSLFAKYA